MTKHKKSNEDDLVDASGIACVIFSAVVMIILGVTILAIVAGVRLFLILQG